MSIRSAARAGRTMSFLRYGLALLAGIGIAIIMYLPAAVVGSIARAATNGQVTLANESGTAWSGSADLNIAVGGPPFTLRDVQWTLRSAELLGLALAFDVKVPGPDLVGRGVVSQRFSVTTLREASFVVPVAWIAARTPFLQPWAPSGTIDVSARAIALGSDRLVGDVDIVGRGIAADKLGALGDYKIVGQPSGNATRFTLTTLGGALDARANGELGVGNALKINGNLRLNDAQSDPTQRARLAPLLALIGPLQTDGSVAFQWPLFGATAAPPTQPRDPVGNISPTPTARDSRG